MSAPAVAAGVGGASQPQLSQVGRLLKVELQRLMFSMR